MLSDAELLHRYCRQHDEPAFAELVQRHLGLVYAAALRRTSGHVQLAEEIAQKVFVELARKANQLASHPTLVGWLYRCTRNSAIDVMRSEQSRQRVAQAYSKEAINDPVELPVDWERLRPELDAAMDQLKDGDRALMLLRFFNGLTFAEVAAKMNLSENAARMRTERALAKLRTHLGRRGVTSTTAALALLLGNETLVAAPAGLASSVAAAALSSPPVTSGLVSLFLMTKITAPAFSFLLASGITAVVWTSVTPAGVSAKDLTALRAENSRLKEAIVTGAPMDAVAGVALEYSAQANAIAEGLKHRTTRVPGSTSADVSGATSAVTPRGHRNHGTATAHDAAMTFAWATDICDPEVLGRLIYFDPPARTKALAVLASMPATIRAQYPTPEALYGLLLAASCLEAPPPGAELLENHQIVELSPGRVSHRPPGTTADHWVFQQTPHGWKYVLPEVGVEALPSILNSRTLAKLVKR